MKKLFLSVFLIASCMVTLNAENNDSAEAKKSTENNNSAKASKIEKQVQEQIEREKKYAKEKTFYQGEEYDIKSHEVDPGSLSKIPTMEPDYDFDMSEGVYSD
ncbi:MAG: hypothetical protein U9Q90_00805 [Campylobacterota bacterium]|nr:hypothetical protein [Campylobacterota bacterium]